MPCACFDYFVTEAHCPTIAIGDGGNEIGMGNALEGLQQLDIIPAVTPCDELLIADVSNWAAFGLIALMGLWAKGWKRLMANNSLPICAN